MAAPTTQSTSAPRLQAAGKRPVALSSLYVSFAVLQGLDVHSTSRALSSGAAREANPAMRGIAGNPAALIAMKTATGALAILATEKMRKKHPRAAVVFMSALNAAVTAVVAHNYSLRSQ